MLFLNGLLLSDLSDTFSVALNEKKNVAKKVMNNTVGVF